MTNPGETGQVIWAEHPEWRRRPALMMAGDEAIGALYEILVVPATATLRELPTEARLRPEDGMPRECVLNLDHVDTVAKGFIGSASRPRARRSSTPCAVVWMSPPAAAEFRCPLRQDQERRSVSSARGLNQSGRCWALTRLSARMPTYRRVSAHIEGTREEGMTYLIPL